MRVVLDTNVLLAAFATRGLCEAVFAACLQSHQIVLSEHILGELARNLTRKLKTPARLAQEIERVLREHCELVEPAVVAGVDCDADDLPVLGAAVAAGAEALVTGDAELLGLKAVAEIPILSVREFYERIREGDK